METVNVLQAMGFPVAGFLLFFVCWVWAVVSIGHERKAAKNLRDYAFRLPVPSVPAEAGANPTAADSAPVRTEPDPVDTDPSLAGRASRRVRSAAAGGDA